MRFILFAFALLFIAGCKKDETTFTTVNWKNVSSHQVHVVGYTAGFVNPGDDVNLAPSQVLKIVEGSQPGKDVTDFPAGAFSLVDSIVVTFDGQYKVTHYVDAPAIQPVKSYPYSSDRNLNNPKSYHKESSQNGTETTTVYTYEFTEADYQFAL